MAIKKEVGEVMLFTGGAEETPRVEVSRYANPESLNHGEKTLLIQQYGEQVQISTETLRAILEWAEKE